MKIIPTILTQIVNIRNEIKEYVEDIGNELYDKGYQGEWPSCIRQQWYAYLDHRRLHYGYLIGIWMEIKTIEGILKLNNNSYTSRDPQYHIEKLNKILQEMRDKAAEYVKEGYLDQ